MIFQRKDGCHVSSISSTSTRCNIYTRRMLTLSASVLQVFCIVWIVFGSIYGPSSKHQTYSPISSSGQVQQPYTIQRQGRRRIVYALFFAASYCVATAVQFALTLSQLSPPVDIVLVMPAAFELLVSVMVVYSAAVFKFVNFI
jgi:hypothetical protein